MSDFLERLVGRVLGTVPVVQPIVPSIFAPDGGRAGWEARPEFPARDHAPPFEIGIPPGAGDVRRATLPEPTGSFRPDSARRADSLPARGQATSLADFEADRETIPGAGPPIKDEPPPFRVAVPTIRAQPGSASTVDAISPRAEIRVEPATIPSLVRGSTEVPPATARRDRALLPVVSPAQERPLIGPIPRRVERARLESQPPIVRVTIGRIDVRAELPAPISHDATARKARPAARSLDDYLRERTEGKR
jgi:hypothetical protein